MATFLITGATSGLGLHVARHLADQGRHHLILPMRHQAQRGPALSTALQRRGARSVLTPELDLASLHDVSRFLREFAPEHGLVPIHGVLLNAGVQSAQKLSYTVDGLETTFAVNHLAQLMLIQGLMKHLAPRGVVGWTASGTHDPCELMARLSGFRGARYTSAQALARGEYEASLCEAQVCRDAYATSKLCNIVTAKAFAQTWAETAWRFFSFDPGMMPGTGLAREHGTLTRWMWTHVLPRLVRALPGTNPPAASAAVLSRLITDLPESAPNGAYFSFKGQCIVPARSARSSWVTTDLMHTSAMLLSPFQSI